MKKIFEEYGFIILTCVVVIALVGIAIGVKPLMASSISNITNSWGSEAKDSLNSAWSEDGSSGSQEEVPTIDEKSAALIDYAIVTNNIEADITYEVAINDSEQNKAIVYVELKGESDVCFDDSLKGENVNHWLIKPLDADENLMPTPFNDLPSGLVASVSDIEDNKATIEISGIVADSNEKGEYQICVAIPGDVVYTSDGNEYGTECDYIYTNLNVSTAYYKLYEPVVSYKEAYNIYLDNNISREYPIIITINDESLLKFDSSILNKQLTTSIDDVTGTISKVADKEIEVTLTAKLTASYNSQLFKITIPRNCFVPSTQDKVVSSNDVKISADNNIPD